MIQHHRGALTMVGQLLATPGAAEDGPIFRFAADLNAAQTTETQATAARSAVRGLPPRRAAQVIVKALTARNPRPRYLVGTDAHAAALIARLPYRLTAAKR